MRYFFSLILSVILAAPLWGQKSADVEPIPVVQLKRKEPVLFDDIVPILRNKCFACHSANVTKGELDLSSYASIVKGGKRGSAIKPGKSAESLLVQLAGKTARPFMPPKREPPLTPTELALLKLWIDQGARPPQSQQAKIAQTPLSSSVRLVRALALTSERTIAAFGNQIHLFDNKTGSLQRSLVDPSVVDTNQRPLGVAHFGLIEALAISPDRKLLASGSFQEALLWDLQTGKVLHKWTGFADRAVALAFSNDGKFLAVGGGIPTADAELVFFDVATGQRVKAFPRIHSDTICGLCFTADNRFLITASADMSVKILDVSTGKVVKKLDGHTHHVVDVGVQADGAIIASAGTDKKVRLWDFKTGEQLTRINRGGGQVTIMAVDREQPACQVRFVGNSNKIIVGGGSEPVTLWELQRIDKASNYYTPYIQPRRLRAFEIGKDYIYAVAATADGKFVAAGGEEGVVRLFDGEKGQLLHTLAPPKLPVIKR